MIINFSSIDKDNYTGKNKPQLHERWMSESRSRLILRTSTRLNVTSLFELHAVDFFYVSDLLVNET